MQNPPLKHVPMYFHLLLFCLYFHNTVCVRFQQHPHVAYERQLSHTVQLETVPEPEVEPDSFGPLSQPRYSLNPTFPDDRRASLKARAGPGTTGTAVLDKTFNKKLKKFLTKWEKSANCKTLNTLFNKILTSPSVQVTRVLWSMPYSLEQDQAVQQLAVFESLLKISMVVLLIDNRTMYSMLMSSLQPS